MFSVLPTQYKINLFIRLMFLYFAVTGMAYGVASYYLDFSGIYFIGYSFLLMFVGGVMYNINLSVMLQDRGDFDEMRMTLYVTVINFVNCLIGIIIYGFMKDAFLAIYTSSLLFLGTTFWYMASLDYLEKMQKNMEEKEGFKS